MCACSDQEQTATAARAQAESITALNPQQDIAFDLDEGKQVFEYWCMPCHGAGPGHAGTSALAVRLGDDQSVLLQRQNMNVETIKFVVRNGFQMMPSIRVTEISDAELDALVAYIVSNGSSND
ncbi:MAG: cytochrome c [Xanthomonadales bacterium]